MEINKKWSEFIPGPDFLIPGARRLTKLILGAQGPPSLLSAVARLVVFILLFLVNRSGAFGKYYYPNIDTRAHWAFRSVWGHAPGVLSFPQTALACRGSKNSCALLLLHP